MPIEFILSKPEDPLFKDDISFLRMLRTLLPLLSSISHIPSAGSALAHGVIAMAWSAEGANPTAEVEAKFHKEYPEGIFPYYKYREACYRPAGMAMLFPDKRDWKKRGDIHGVIVHPDFRRQGIAKKLMGMLIEAAQERKLTELRLTSGDQRIDAHKLYRELGFEPVPTTVFRLDLTKTRDGV